MLVKMKVDNFFFISRSQSSDTNIVIEKAMDLPRIK